MEFTPSRLRTLEKPSAKTGGAGPTCGTCAVWNISDSTSRSIVNPHADKNLTNPEK
jgi:hypothetical protein